MFWYRLLGVFTIVTLFSIAPSQSAEIKIIASDSAAQDGFGGRVALSGDTLVLGAPGDDDGVAQSGSAYVFVRNGTTWSQQAKLVASDPGPDYVFGSAVDIDGDTIVVMATRGSSGGAAYVYQRSGTTWSQQAVLTGSGQFGFSVDISGDTIAIGAQTEGGQSGAVYVFVRSGTNWSQQAKLTASDGAARDEFGVFVAIGAGIVVVGSEVGDGVVVDTGAAYVYDILAEQTPTGFYYPTGADVLSTFAGWLAMGCNGSTDYLTDRYHLGKDIVADVDAAVYAIADGEVLLKSVNGWGQINVALIMRHALANGIEFFAVYGHIRSALEVGDRVKAGESFATIGPWRYGAHLHFGIHLGPTFPATHLGLMPCANWPKTHGFVEPISWITTQTPGGLL